MLLQLVVLVKVALLVVLYSLQVVLGVLNYLLDVLSEMSCIRFITLGTHNDINRQPNLFLIYRFKWRAANALCWSRVDSKLNIVQQVTPL